MKQVCKSCGIDKPLTDYEHQKNRPNPRKTCKQCRYVARDREAERERHREYMANRRKNDPDGVRQNWERCVYGASKEDIGVSSCMICDSTERLCIDHDHNTTNVRGILCSSCNTGLGLFRDNPEFLLRAVKYLKDGPHYELDRKKYK